MKPPTHNGPVIIALIVAGLLLLVTPAIHAAVREANALYALGISARQSADPARKAAMLEAWLADLPPIPGPMHWVMMISGVGCLGVGINMAVGRLGANADDQEPEHDAYPRR
jgi:hypothetical protein